MEYHEKNKDYFVIKYEDFIDNKVKGLENFLGFPLSETYSVDKEFDRVARTKKYGSWKNWFLEKDIKFFMLRFSGFMQKYTYSDKWALANPPVINPQHSSLYVKSLVQKRQEIDRKKVSV